MSLWGHDTLTVWAERKVESMTDENNSGTPPEGAPKSTAPAPAPQLNTISLTSEQLDERLGRAKGAYMREQFGTNDPEEVKSRLARLQEMEAAEAEREREAMSAQEKLQQDLKLAQEERIAAQEERDAIAFESHVKGECAKLGIKNVDFAMWEVARAAEGMGEGEQLDAQEHLKGLTESEQYKAALGIEAAKVVTQAAGATTHSGARARG